jgi:hypothetical protein
MAVGFHSLPTELLSLWYMHYLETFASGKKLHLPSAERGIKCFLSTCGCQGCAQSIYFSTSVALFGIANIAITAEHLQIGILVRSIVAAL